MGEILGILRRHKAAYATINVVYYGLVAVGALAAALNPGLQELLIEQVGQAFVEGPLAPVGEAYLGGNLPAAIGLTFGVNLIVGSFLTLTLPSLIVPFFGLLMGVYRAVLWGLIMSPAYPELAGPMIPHSITLLLEGQAYVVAMLAVWVHGVALFRPESVGATGHWAGYLEGLRKTARLYLLVAGLLLVAAVYEALEVIFILGPQLGGG